MIKTILFSLGDLRELPDPADVGMGANLSVRNLHRDPDGTFTPLSLTDELHDPCFFLVADSEGLSLVTVTVLVHQLAHDADSVSCG